MGKLFTLGCGLCCLILVFYRQAIYQHLAHYYDQQYALFTFKLALLVALTLCFMGALIWLLSTLFLRFYSPTQAFNFPLNHLYSFSSTQRDCLDWRCGQQAPWDIAIHNGQLNIRNESEPYAINFVYLNDVGFDNEVSQPLAVDLSFSQLMPTVYAKDAYSGAGLLLNYNPDTGHYLGFVLNPQGRLIAFQFDQSGVTHIYSVQIKAFKRSEQYRLAAATNEQSIDLYLNQQLLRSIALSAKPRYGHNGLLILGQGHYQFDNFALYQAP